MNWDDVRIVLAIARAGSLSGAARVLAVQHTTVSRRLRAFEERLGVRVFDRHHRKMVPTEAGAELLAGARRAEEEMLGIERRLEGLDDRVSGALRVSTADAMAETFLMPMFAEFAALHRGVDLEIAVSNRYVSLREREAEIVIRASNNPPEDLIGQRLVRLGFAVFGESSYLAEHRAGGEISWIGAGPGLPHRDWVRMAIGSARVSLTVDEANLTLQAVRNGAGVGFMPCFMGDPVPELERYLSPDVGEVGLDLWVLFHPDLRRSARVRVFRDFITERIRAIKSRLEGSG